MPLGEKTVNEVLGDSYKYEVNLYNTDYSFCKKYLIYCCGEATTENLLFILVCDKYIKSGAPDWVNFYTIYNEFVKVGSTRQVNLPSALVLPIKLLADKSARDFVSRDVSNLFIFEDAVAEIKKLSNADTVRRLKACSYTKAFLLDTPMKKTYYDSAIACLKTYGISLLGV